MARVFVLWAGGTWRSNEVEEWVRPEDLVDEIVSVASRSREEAAGAVLHIQEMGRKLAARGVADLVRTYMEVLSVLGLPCGSGADRARQERALGSTSALLVDFEHSMKRAAPPPGSGLEWLNGTGLDAEAEFAEERAVAEAHEAGTEEGVARETPAPGATRRGLPERATGWGLASFGEKLVPGEIFLAHLKVFSERFASQAVEETTEGVEPDAGAVLRAAGGDPSTVEIVDIKTTENPLPLPQDQNQLRVYAQAARTLGLNPVCLLIHDLHSEADATIPEGCRRHIPAGPGGLKSAIRVSCGVVQPGTCDLLVSAWAARLDRTSDSMTSCSVHVSTYGGSLAEQENCGLREVLPWEAYSRM